MNIVTATAAILLAASCTTPERNRRLLVQQCSPVMAYETVEIVRDGVALPETILDMAKSQCLCREYKFSLDFMGPISGTTTVTAIANCDRIVGYPLGDYSNLTTFLGTVRRDIQENTKR